MPLLDGVDKPPRKIVVPLLGVVPAIDDPPLVVLNKDDPPLVGSNCVGLLPVRPVGSEILCDGLDMSGKKDDETLLRDKILFALLGAVETTLGNNCTLLGLPMRLLSLLIFSPVIILRSLDGFDMPNSFAAPFDFFKIDGGVLLCVRTSTVLIVSLFPLNVVKAS